MVKLLVSGDSQIGPKLIKMDQNENSSSKYSTFYSSGWKQSGSKWQLTSTNCKAYPTSNHHSYGFRSLVCFFSFHGLNCKTDRICPDLHPLSLHPLYFLYALSWISLPRCLVVCTPGLQSPFFSIHVFSGGNVPRYTVCWLRETDKKHIRLNHDQLLTYLHILP